MSSIPLQVWNLVYFTKPYPLSFIPPLIFHYHALLSRSQFFTIIKYREPRIRIFVHKIVYTCPAIFSVSGSQTAVFRKFHMSTFDAFPVQQDYIHLSLNSSVRETVCPHSHQQFVIFSMLSQESQIKINEEMVSGFDKEISKTVLFLS